MLNILNFPEWLSNELILEDGTWQHATIFDLNTNNLFWNRAALITLPKHYTTEASSALIYLLQKEARTLTLWEQEWGNATPTMDNFIKCISAWGRFTNTAGYAITIEEFWESYDATIKGIVSHPTFEFTEEGISKTYVQILFKENIVQVICFDDKWNEQNFFIETSTEWILFNWGTMA